VLDGAHQGTVFVLAREVHTIGRSAGNDFHLADPTVSRTQAEFRCSAEGVVVAGMSDKNPVWINGEMVGNVRKIAFGDKIQLGLVHLTSVVVPRPVALAGPPTVATGGLSVTTGTVFQGESIPAARAAGPGNPCPACGTLEHSGARFCGTCGARLAVAAAGEASPSASTMREAPPARVSAPPPPPSPRDPTVASPPRLSDVLPAPSTVTGRSRSGPQIGPGVVLRNRFELKKLVGRGRITEVYLAHDREQPREIAVKLLVPELSVDPETRDQFFNACNAFVVNVHPNLLKVLEVHEEGDLCFCVVEPAQGITLQEQMRTRPVSAGGLPIADVARIGMALCHGLDKLHAVGPHGNVRPEKVWVTPQGSVKLIDPGLLAPQGKPARWPPAWDLGSAVYTAPEVVKGGIPDVRADVYSVAAILFHLLTMEPPAGRIPHVSELRKDCPSGMAKAIDRALATKPESRTASAAEFAAALSAAAGSTPGGGKRKLVVGIVAGTMALLCGAASSVLWYPPAQKFLRKTTAERKPADLDPARRKPGEELEKLKADSDLARFLPAALGGEVDALVKEGDALRDDLWLAKAEEKYAAASKRVAEAREAATARREQFTRATADLHALESAMGAEAGRDEALSKFEDAAKKALRIAVGKDDDTTVKGRVEQKERRASLRAQEDLVGGVLKSWTTGLADAALAEIRAGLPRAQGLLDQGEYVKSAETSRAALLAYHRALCDRMKAAVSVAVEKAGPGLAGLDAARALQAAAAETEKRDLDAGVAAWEKAREAWAGLLPAAAESFREKCEKEQRELRCPTCNAEGRCTGCPETRGKVLSQCPACAGKAVFQDPCPECKGKATQPCPECKGATTVVQECPTCKGSGKKACGKCKDGKVACDNPRCKEGKVPCLRCKGTGKPTAMGEGTTCKDCNGVGRKPCPVCAGAGSKTCPTCGGKGQGDCPDCKGAKTRNVTCPACAGKGTTGCPKCEAKGTVPRNCPACAGSGKASVDCGKCRGTGDCPDCGGKGRRE
jgi:serine/threonine-protein kinase